MSAAPFEAGKVYISDDGYITFLVLVVESPDPQYGSGWRVSYVFLDYGRFSAYSTKIWHVDGNYESQWKEVKMT